MAPPCMSLALLTVLSLSHRCGASQPAHAAEQREAHSGDYQKYMAGYQKYFAGASTDQQSHAGEDFQKYTAGYKKYMTDYQKYLGAAAKGEPSLGEPSEKADAGYMALAQGEQQKNPGDVSLSAEASAGDDQKYMTQYLKFTGATQGDWGNQSDVDFQRYMANYQKYMAGGNRKPGDYTHASAEEGQMKTGDFNQYMQTYGGDFQKYMADYQKYAQTRAGDHQEYMPDLQKYVHTAGEPQLQGSPQSNVTQLVQLSVQSQPLAPQLNSSDKTQPEQSYVDGKRRADDLQKSYMDKYAAQFKHFAQKQADQDGKRRADDLQKSYMDKYAAQFRHFAQKQAEQETRTPASAKDCQNVTELKAWRDAELKRISNYVPKAYSSKAEDGIERVYRNSLARIENSTQAEEARVAQAEKKPSDQSKDEVEEPRVAHAEKQPSGQGKESRVARVEKQPRDQGKDKVKSKAVAADKPSSTKEEEIADEATKRNAATAKGAKNLGMHSQKTTALATRDSSKDLRAVGTVGLVCLLGAAASGVVAGLRSLRQRDIEGEGYVNMEEP